MLTQLGNELSGWRPRAGRPDDPLATIRAAWNEIVGADVARAVQPVALRNSALLLMTASAAWSHQLAFLEREIVRKVQALGVGEVERLRFRVGTVRTARGRTAPSDDGPTAMRRGSAPAGRPASVAEALARLRSATEARRAAHAAAGGGFCAHCGAAVGAGSPRCRPCADDDARRRRDHCERILFESPWLEPEAVLCEVAGLTPEEYDRSRRRLLRSWIDELRYARKRHEARAPIDRVRIRKLASSYVLLETRIDPNRLELDSPVRANALGDLYSFIRSVEMGTG